MSLDLFFKQQRQSEEDATNRQQQDFSESSAFVMIRIFPAARTAGRFFNMSMHFLPGVIYLPTDNDRRKNVRLPGSISGVRT
jgi:hypothetical protein